MRGKVLRKKRSLSKSQGIQLLPSAGAGGGGAGGRMSRVPVLPPQ